MELKFVVTDQYLFYRFFSRTLEKFIYNMLILLYQNTVY